MKEADFRRRLAQMMVGPVFPEKQFLLSTTTYRQVYAMAADIRAYFGADNAVEQVVCLCTDHRGVTAAAVLAALAGGLTLVLPYAFDLQVLEALRQSTGFRHAIIDSPRDLPPGVRGIVPSIAERRWSPVPESMPVNPERTWMYLFTGGTTGAPRLWPKTVRNLLAESFYLQDTHQVTAGDRLVATVNPHHIYGLLYSILLPVAASASVFACTPSFPAEIETALRESAATLLISVPAHYRALNGYPLKALALRRAFSSAGLLAAQDGEAFSTQTGVDIVEIYGSTETGGVASRIRAAGQVDFAPFESVDLQIEGESMRIRSDYLSPGLIEASDGYFQLSDRAVATAQNRFMLLGRADGVVKVGGKRVDMEAVRQTLRQDPRIEEAVVIALPVGKARENQIVAVVEGNLSVEELTWASRKALEAYACPRRFKIIDKIPTTGTGKFDRKTIEGMFL
jgi:acyl-coenzyme A synthetase/AMP-(fatty) acid ligase